jgi:NodT family efflux transporter outer membrane factor (OMF) lipoprotein
MWRGSIRIAVLAALLGGCATVPKLGTAPTPKTPASLAASESLAGTPRDWPASDWWSAYRDPQLTALIEEAFRGTPDIAAADARVRAANALAQQAGATLQPQVSASGSIGGNKQSENIGIPPAFVPKGIQDTGNLAISTSFNLDLWGRDIAALRAARGDAEAARIEAAQTRMVLASSIAAAYAELQQYFVQRDVALEALRVREATARLTSERVLVGVDTRGSLRQAEARVLAARADVLALDEAIALTRHRIAALLGAGPDRGLQIARPRLAAPDAGIPVNAGVDLVGRRPDLEAARLRAESAAQRIRVARADFYPNINLTALIGLQSLGLNQLIQGGSSYGNGGVALSLPIFDGGRIAGRYRQSRAQYDEAVARYDATLVTALREVADAATSRTAADTRLAEQRASLAAASEAANIARLRYRGGLSNQLAVLIAEDTELAARRAVADLEARQIALDIALIRALGGGYRTNIQTAGAQ